MPISVSAAIILVVAVFPGILGEWAFRLFLGVDWREREWRGFLRLAGFSVVGATFYTVLARAFNLPPPYHLFPSQYAGLLPEDLFRLAPPYLGHLASGFVAGLVAVIGSRIGASLTSSSAYPAAWDDFARTYASEHWVVVSLTNGSVFAGKLKNADVGVATEDRDLVLEEPCEFDEKTRIYRAMNYQHLFLPAERVYSVAAIHEPKLDKRTVPVGEVLFTKEDRNVEEGTPGSAAST